MQTFQFGTFRKKLKFEIVTYLNTLKLVLSVERVHFELVANLLLIEKQTLESQDQGNHQNITSLET